jgi:hypothetical protein
MGQIKRIDIFGNADSEYRLKPNARWHKKASIIGYFYGFYHIT